MFLLFYPKEDILPLKTPTITHFKAWQFYFGGQPISHLFYQFQVLRASFRLKILLVIALPTQIVLRE